MRDTLAAQAQSVLSAEYGLNDVSIAWELPQDPAHGDLATPVSLQVAKQAGQAPRNIAEKIAAALGEVEGVEKAEVAGPGYVNIWCTSAALLAQLPDALQSCHPTSPRKGEDPVIVEYSQPNVAKPLGVHHLLSTVVGQAIANLYRHGGYNVIAWNYMGDWGTQFGKLSVAVKKWGDGRETDKYSIDELLDLYVQFHNEAENDDTLEDEARAEFARLEQGDEEIRAFWSDVVSTTKQALQQTYDRLHVQFDTDISESFYEDKMMPVIEEGKKSGVFKEGEKGALIAEFPEETHLQPAIVLKADGATIYHTRDLANVRYRVDTHHPQAILYVVDTAQENYFQQLFGIVRQLEWDLPKLEHVVIGRMSFADKSMSTRKGNILRLEELLNESYDRAAAVITEHGDSIQTDDAEDLAEMMGIGAVAYGVLSQNRRMNMIFDWDKCLSFDGNSAPYLQYTHARARSVLQKAGDESTEVSGDVEMTEKDRVLLNLLLQYGDVLEEARTATMPHVLANYLYQLCQQFNSLYGAEPILQASGLQRALRLTLTSAVAEVLKSGAELLTIRVPDRM